MLNCSTNLDDVKVPLGDRLELLKGKRIGQHSVRINDQWRFVLSGKMDYDLDIAADQLEEKIEALHRLTWMPILCILMHMRTTLNINDDLLAKASELTGIAEKTALVRLGLEALIARESARRLAKLGGTEKQLREIPRRRVG